MRNTKTTITDVTPGTVLLREGGWAFTVASIERHDAFSVKVRYESGEMEVLSDTARVKVAA